MKQNFVPDGCFHLARQIFESPIWRDDPHVLKLFIYLIGKARYKVEVKKYPGFEIKRGELVTSLSQISEDNEFYNRTIKKWSRAKVSRMLQILKEQGYINILADTYGTHISICNYDRFQDINNYKADSNETQVKRKRNASETEVSINNNEKNVKNEKKEDIYTIFDYWNSKNIVQHRKVYDFKSPINAKLKNYSVEEIQQAIDNYETVLKGDKYYWTHKWTLKEFMQRGFDKFFNVPVENYLCKEKKKNKTEDERMEEMRRALRD